MKMKSAMKSVFPLYKNDGVSLIKLTKNQEEYRKILLEKITSKELKLVKNNCICGNNHEDSDVVIAEKDRYGIPIKMICCSKCGLIRSDEVFDEKSNELFYAHYYRPIYSSLCVTDDFFNDQYKRGRQFLKLVQKYVNLSEIEHVAEIGCGAGGILLPFKEAGKETTGVDFGEDYIIFGQKKGLNLQKGSDDLLEDESVDLLILSHVMEHYLSPLSELQNNIRKIKKGKYLLLEVPGIFSISMYYFNPISYFQSAHVYNYYYNYLVIMLQQLGLEVIYGDERCTFICKKKEKWEPVHIQKIEISDQYPDIVLSYLQKQCRAYNYRFFNIKFLKHKALMLANKLGYQKIRRWIV